jgi:hypothetical protein
MATTYTYTATFARLELIKMQVRIALRRTLNISESELSKVEKWLDARCIQQIIIYAKDDYNLCRAKLEMEIDWDEYNFQLSRGRAKVTIDDKWIEGTAVEVDEIIRMFNKFVSSNSLATSWGFTLNPKWTDTSDNRQKLGIGLGSAPPEKWKGQGRSYAIPELSELRVGFYFSE